MNEHDSISKIVSVSTQHGHPIVAMLKLLIFRLTNPKFVAIIGMLSML